MAATWIHYHMAHSRLFCFKFPTPNNEKRGCHHLLFYLIVPLKYSCITLSELLSNTPMGNNFIGVQYLCVFLLPLVLQTPLIFKKLLRLVPFPSLPWVKLSYTCRLFWYSVRSILRFPNLLDDFFNLHTVKLTLWCTVLWILTSALCYLLPL